MNLNDYIAQAKKDYPNGYSDYIAKNPEDTPEVWELNLDMRENREIRVNDVITIRSFKDMPNWDNNILWALIGSVEYQFNKLK